MMDETIPEIQRTNLANTILYLKAIGINNILCFDFLDPPSIEQVLQALTELYALQALNKLGEITSIGRKMSMFPLDPHLSRMLIESYCHPACQFIGTKATGRSIGGCWQDMVIICAMLSVENIWHRPRVRHDTLGEDKSNTTGIKSSYRNNNNDQQPVAGFSSRIQFHAKGWGKPNLSSQDQEDTTGSNPPTNNNNKGQQQVRVLSAEEERCEIAYAGLRHEYGDLLTYWNVFSQWEIARYSFDWCEQHFINYRSMKMARKIRYATIIISPYYFL